MWKLRGGTLLLAKPRHAVKLTIREGRDAAFGVANLPPVSDIGD